MRDFLVREAWLSSAHTFFVLIILSLLASIRLAHGQVTILSETFEGSFPADNGWSVGDADPAGTTAVWDDVDTNFGGEGAHTGFWKGYCAGSNYGGTVNDPVYHDFMRAFMRRAIDLTGYAGAELRFWFKVPSMDSYYDNVRVFIDEQAVYARETSEGAENWKEARMNLSDFVGGIHNLSFEFISDDMIINEGCYLDDITVVAYASAPNDNFANAMGIGGAMGFINGFNNGATKENGEPTFHAGNGGGASIWYRWTAPSGTSVNFNTSGSSFDTVLAVYTGSSVGALTEVVSNDDIFWPQNAQSTVRFTPVAGATYWIAVDGFGGRTGALRLNWQQGGVPDLIIHGPAVGPHFSVETFADNSCEVMEQLISAGTRKLVRFTTQSRNIGSSDLLLGDPAGNPLFTPALCHVHNHFDRYAQFRVRDSGGNVVANGGKVGFCLEDTGRWNIAANPLAVFSCAYQGLQAGWSDTYASHLSGQWVDITGLPAGNYILEQEVNPDHILEETSYANNITQVPFTIPPYNNDYFVNATRIGANISSVTGNNGTATKEPNEPNHAGNAGGRSIWYCWTATISAGVVFDTIGSDFDTLLAVYTGNSLATMVLIGQNDDINGALNRASRVTFAAVAGTTYWIAVDGYNGAAGSVVLNLSPANNDFAACQNIMGAVGSVIGFNLGAARENGEPLHAGSFNGGPSVWYCWTAPFSDLIEFNTFGSNFDTLLGVYTGGSVSSLTEVTGNDDTFINGSLSRQSRVIFSATGGTTYRIAVDGYGAATGSINLNWGYKCRLTGSNSPSGHFIITLQGVPRQTYSLEASDNFVFWSPVDMLTTDVHGAGAYDIGPVMSPSHRFYRASLQP